MVIHIVMWTFHPQLNKNEVVAKMKTIFGGFSGDVPGMLSLEVNRGYQGFDACLISRHESREALEVYQSFPAHKEAKEYVHSVINSRASCDFEE